jgi:hypothetical protein
MTSPEALKQAPGTSSRGTKQGRTGTPNAGGLSLVRLRPGPRLRGHHNPARDDPRGEPRAAGSEPKWTRRGIARAGKLAHNRRGRRGHHLCWHLPKRNRAGKREDFSLDATRRRCPGIRLVGCEPGSDHASTRSASEGLACAAAHVTQPSLARRVSAAIRKPSRKILPFCLFSQVDRPCF